MQELFEKYLSGMITKEEYKRLLDHFSLDGNLKDIHSLILRAIEQAQQDEASDPVGLEKTLSRTDSYIYKIARRNNTRKTLVKRIFPYISAAVLLVVGIFSYVFFIRNPKELQKTTFSIAKDDILPGRHTAVLSLSSGKSYNLSDRKDGITTDEKAIHYSGGEKIADTKNNETVHVTVPRGGQYSLYLPDGTKVILNSESSISFPVSFSGSTREINMKGEAYFEVAHNSRRPFIVNTLEQNIKVLGTKFNLYSYSPEDVVTTLLEGKVEVNATGTDLHTVLKPGEQSSVRGKSISKRKVDPLDYIGWTSDVFIFNDLKLTEIMRQLSHWYDIEVIYPPSFKDQSFFAEIPRDRKLSEVLRALEHSGNFTFEIKGRRIMVRQ